VLFRQLDERRPDAPLLLVAQDVLGGAPVQLLAGEQDAVQLRCLRRFGPPVPLRQPAGPVTGDGIEPRREPLRIIQLRQRLEGDQERVLRRVLGSGPRAQHLLRDRQHRPAVPAHQLIERLQVAEERVQHDLCVLDLREMPSIGFQLRSLPDKGDAGTRSG